MAKLGPGARIGDQFNLIRKIGEGGCGEVYLAEQTSLGRNAVVKLMHPELSRDASYVARFRREAQLAARLTHHHTAAIYAFGETPERVLWIAMEYIEGESLHNVLARDPAREIGDLLTPVADVLDRAGALGIIHRDVKPDNIIVAPDGTGRRAVLLDFGLARPKEDNDKLTAVGVAVGSPTYMSPEQVFGPAVDSATDRYALGIILYIAVTKRPPFRHDDRVQLVLMHKRQPVPALGTIVPAIAPGHVLDQFFTKALAKQPQDRYPSARQMLIEFMQALDQSPLGHSPPVPAPSGPAPSWQAPTTQGARLEDMLAASPLGAGPPGQAGSIGQKATGPQHASKPPAASGRRAGPPPLPRGATGRGAAQRPSVSPAPVRPPLVPPPVATFPTPEGRGAPPEDLTEPPTPVDGFGRQKSDPTQQMTAATAAALTHDATAANGLAQEDEEDEPQPGHRRLLARTVGTQRVLDILCGNEVTLGKHRDCDLVCRAFPTPEQDAITHGVSRQHAKLRVSGGKLLVEDQSSLNGTFLDDKRLGSAAVALYDEARLRLGPVLTIEVRMFRSGAVLFRRVDPYHGGFPTTLLIWDKVSLGEPALGLVPPTGDSVTRWGMLQHSKQAGELWWGGPTAVAWERADGDPDRPQALQPQDRLVLGPVAIEWVLGTKPGLG